MYINIVNHKINRKAVIKRTFEYPCEATFE